jgi:hypothetical protein
LLTAALSAGAGFGLASSAAASTPQPVTIDTTFWFDPQATACGGGYTSSVKLTGDVFPNGVANGTDCNIRAIGTHVPKTWPFAIIDTFHRTDVFTLNDGSGTFTLGINKVSTLGASVKCPTLPNGDETFTGDQCNTEVYKGSATVKGGTGLYTNLRGTLDFTSHELFDTTVFGVIMDTEDMVGSLHIDP